MNLYFFAVANHASAADNGPPVKSTQIAGIFAPQKQAGAI
jgi:hypothetical protein